MMRLLKDSTVRRVVVSLLVAVGVLFPLSVLLTRNSQGTSVSSIAAVFSSLQSSAPSPSRPGADFANQISEEFLQVADSSLTPDSDGNLRNQTADNPSPSPVVVTVSLPLTSDNDASTVEDVLGSFRGPLNRSEAKRQRVFQPSSLPHYSFVKFSAYRQSLRTILVVGITSYVARAYDRGRIVHSCEWHPAPHQTGLVETQPEHIYWKTDENGGTYNPTTINCTFDQEVGADGKGGLLVLRITTGYDRWERNLPVVVMEEVAGEVDVVRVPAEELPFKYAFCGAPMHGTVRADWVLQWLKYHHYLAEGSAHFFFYNLGGLADSDRPKFRQFSDAGKLSITDILDPNLVADYPTWYHHQVLLINDCLHRSRFMAQRVFFIDYDEFVQIPAPDTLSMFMARHKLEPWISLGSMYANTRNCRSTQSGEAILAPLERMLWRRPMPDCRNRPPTKTPTNPWLCIGPLGRRKFVVNPRETFAAGVHWATLPEKGLNLDAKEAHILHYRRAPVPKAKLCSKIVTLSDAGDITRDEKVVLDDGWIRDESTSKIYSMAKSFPI